MVQLTDMHKYETDEGHSLADIYALMFRSVYPFAFQKHGESDTCKGFEQHARQLQRFRVDCDLGNVAVTLREPFVGEHWTVPVAEGFIEYLSQQTTLRCEEYGIDVTEIITTVISHAVDYEPFLVRFVPENILTREWLLMMIGPAPEILRHLKVDEALMRDLVVANPMSLKYVPAEMCTKSLALAALRKEFFALNFVPDNLKLEVCTSLCEELGRENFRLRQQLAA